MAQNVNDEGLKEALKRINECKHDTSQTSLDLSNLDLAIIPKDLASISHLTILDLSGNQIIKIEGLPPTLTVLHLSNNQINKIEGLPPTLTELYLINNQIIKIEGLPPTLTELYLINNQIIKIEGLPPTLTKLDLSGNQIIKIEGLPPTLTVLYLSSNQINKIEGLPPTLTELYLINNQINKIEGLPPTLTELDLSYNQIIKIEGLPPTLTELDLSYNQINKIEGLPPTLTELYLINNQIIKIEGLPPTLTKLYLINNQIIKIEGLPPTLTKLDLSENQINKIEGLPPTLTVLYLSSNQINKIEGLPPTLTELYLINNQIIKIEGLPPTLTELYLINNQIIKIEGLPPTLTELDLSYNQIIKIEGLPPTLTELYLINNQIIKIEGLPPTLTALYLSYNQIIKIEGLPPTLTVLYLSSNQIIKIEGLPPTLTVLYLSSNQIIKIEGLPPTLTALYLNYNQINDLDDLLGLMPLLVGNQLTRFDISDNPFFKKYDLKKDLYPLGYYQNHTQRLLSDLNYILEQQENLTQVVTDIMLPSKLLLLGNSDAGKSTLCQYILNGKYATEKTESTDVLDVSGWYYDEEEEDRYGFIYDFGGQDYFHGTYQLFFSRESVYAVVWDHETNRNQLMSPTTDRPYPYYNYTLNYWLGNIRYLTADLANIRALPLTIQDEDKEATQIEKSYQSQPVTLIENKIDKANESPSINSNDLTDQNIRDHFRISLVRSPICVSAYSERRKLVKEHLRAELSGIHDAQSFRTDHAQLIEAYLKKKEKENTELRVHKTDFLDWCFGDTIPLSWQHDRALSEVEAVLQLLHNRGLLLYYHDDPIITDTVYIDPEGILQNIKSEVFQTGRAKQGKLGRADMILDPEDLQLAISQSIIFHNKHSKHPDVDEYIIPALLNGTPEQDQLLYDFAISNMKIKFSLRFKDFMPYGIMNRLICGYGNNPHEKHFYQNELIFRLDRQTKVWIQCVPEDLMISVYVDLQHPSVRNDLSVTKYLHHTLMACYYRIPVLSWEAYKNRSRYESVDTRHGEFQKGITKSVNEAEHAKKGLLIDPAWEQFYAYEKAFYLQDEVQVPQDMMVSRDGTYYISHSELMEVYDNGIKEIKGIHIEDLSLSNEATPQRYKMLDRYRFRAFTAEQDDPPKKVFVSYAHADMEYKEDLMKYLIGMRREKLIEVWEDGRLNPGDQWDDEIRSQLQQAEWVILLISQQFINSSYIYEKELTVALQNAEQGRAKLLPIIIEDCDWSSLPLSFKDVRMAIEQERLDAKQEDGKDLSYIESMPKDKRSQLLPINEWGLPNKAWMEVVRKLRGLIM